MLCVLYTAVNAAQVSFVLLVASGAAGQCYSALGLQRQCGLHSATARHAATGGSNPSLYGTIEPPLPPPELLSCVHLLSTCRERLLTQTLVDLIFLFSFAILTPESLS